MIKLFDRLTHAINLVGNLAFFLIMIMVMVHVVMRYVFASAVPGFVELVSFLQVIGVGLGLAYAQREHANVNVEFFLAPLPARAKAVLAIIVSLVSSILFALMTYGIIKLASTTGAMREVSDALGLPLYPFRWLMGAGFGLLSLQLLIEAFRAMLALRTPGETAL
ncbi:MAG: TRAP transporter small permease [Rhodobiaceae bacterium]|nr:TRAP transporter small permease [Rhodobiaceae bacterium]MCC0057324.1 TRAP transporter small permease [Rhodobiaceae bacterium]